MIATIQHQTKQFKVDFSKPLDISIPLRASKDNVNAWYIGEPKIEPVKNGDWVGSIKEGAAVNFNNIKFNPHAHGTHTECIGHITEEFHSINENLKQFFFTAEVISVAPEKYMKDTVVSKKQLEILLKDKTPEALVIRTLPNMKEKKSRHYSETNWTYLLEEAMVFVKEKGIKHLLIDLPSVDREHDGGKLSSHKAFWNFNGERRMDCTITEFIYVPNKVKDGTYVLNLQIAAFENDATPSKPVLYRILD
ncbi:MAG: cyclase family protein [Aquaticitalea sp.]